MTRTRDVTTTMHRRQRAIPLLVVGAACLAWGAPATAEDCGSPCTVTREGLPTFRLVNTGGVADWDLETSAFGVELAPRSDNPNTGAFRVEHGAHSNTLVIDDFGRVGIGTSAPIAALQINSTFPRIRLDDISSGSGLAELLVTGNDLWLQGTSTIIARIATGSPFAMKIDDGGNVGVTDSSGFVPQARFHVDGDVRVEGDVALGSNRTLKTAFNAVDPAEVLARLADLPVASWRYKTDEESARHIGPFAEDFQRLFGLGDGETISVIDAQGVALAAIQGLKQELEARSAEIAELRTAAAGRHEELARFRSELAELKSALE